MDMHPENNSLVTEIFLLGFQNIQNVKIFFFLLLLIIFCVTVCGNLLIILVVSFSRSLHFPIYFFLTQLSFSDILLTTTIVPIMLRVVLFEGSYVSFVGCLAQYHVFVASEALECFLLTVMSYDRYQAICNPLHYSTVIDIKFCLKSIFLFWLIIFSVILTFSITMSQYKFCGHNVIDHFFCDLDPILELSCSDTSLVKIESMILVIPIVLCPFTVIIVSYAYIIFTILKIPSVTGRQKTFSTCSSHLAVVCIYYGSIMSIYLFPNTEGAKKLISLFYTVITPILNPIIYSLSNRDLKQAFRKLMSKLSSVLQLM
ncbi:olfactory receptor 11L1-like [Anomaloglossus baeobatrachus]|uniref:olfactory receptor 11L1-like n=1 Tax=Anomaloglossus baeobatrachus TaxID=238106 RepID=UPI003F4FF273